MTCNATRPLRPAQQRPQLIRPNRLALVLPFKNAIGQAALVAVQFDDALLDRARGDEAVHRHRPRLPDVVGAARGLVFGGRVPPGVDDQHVVGHLQVQAESAGLQADEVEVALAAVSAAAPVPSGTA